MRIIPSRVVRYIRIVLRISWSLFITFLGIPFVDYGVIYLSSETIGSLRYKRL